MHEKLSGGFVEFPAVANDPDLSRTACLSREAIGEAQGGVVMVALCMQGQPVLPAQSLWPAE